MKDKSNRGNRKREEVKAQKQNQLKIVWIQKPLNGQHA